MDPFAELLRGLRLTGGIFIAARFTAPWAVLSQIAPADVAGFIPGAEQVIGYHVVTGGDVVLSVPGEAPVTVAAGEVVLLPHGEQHELASGAGIAPVDAHDLLRPGPDGGMARIDHGGGGAETRIYCGFLGTAGGFSALVAGLPRILKVDARDVAARDWIEASVRYAAEGLAAGRLPATDLVSRLSESLLIEAVRQYLAAEDAAVSGWLAAARDPQVGRALALIHADLAAPLTVDRLAAEAAMSRTAFVARFGALMGEPPMRYIAARRIEAAGRRLSETDDPIATIAWDLGYGSEEAFSRAFRRITGAPPGRWRGRARTRETVPA